MKVLAELLTELLHDQASCDVDVKVNHDTAPALEAFWGEVSRLASRGPVVILAGNYRQFIQYLATMHKSPRSKNFVFGDHHSLRGIGASSIKIIGDFWRRSDAQELYHEALMVVR